MRRLTILIASVLLGAASLCAAADLLHGPGGHNGAMLLGGQCKNMSETNPDCKFPGKSCLFYDEPGRCSRPTGITMCTCIPLIEH